MSELATDSRTAARELIKASIEPALWEQNEAFSRKLVAETILAHRLHRHPILDAWNRSEFNLAAIRLVHMEVRAAFLETFSESLLRLMQTSSQLEATLGFKAKLAARFLVQLNVLDEIGFALGTSSDGHNVGHPKFAHYWLLADAMQALGLTEAQWRTHTPSPEARATRATLDGNQNDHLRLAVLLACIETVFMPYYNPWAKNSIKVCPALSAPNGYHSVHIEDDEGHSVDDDHSEDSWYVVRQALAPSRYEEIREFTASLLETWAQLFDSLLTRSRAL